MRFACAERIQWTNLVLLPSVREENPSGKAGCARRACCLQGKAPGRDKMQLGRGNQIPIRFEPLSQLPRDRRLALFLFGGEEYGD